MDIHYDIQKFFYKKECKMSRKYAILGETLKHTMSPPIHARLFELKNREYEYEIYGFPSRMLVP